MEVKLLNSEKLWKGNKKSVRLRISFYGKQNTVQIGKDVVRVLGAPQFISIRINKDMSSILLEAAEEQHKLAFKVPTDLYTNNNAHMKIKSVAFVNSVMTRNALESTQTYLIEGIYSEKNNAVIFNLADAVLYDTSKKSITPFHPFPSHNPSQETADKSRHRQGS